MENIKFIFTLLLLAGLLFGCGKPASLQSSNTPQVEEITDPLMYPSVVMVVLPGGSGICTGTFISPRAVLTAAHCVKSNGLYRVVTGFGTFSTSVKEYLGPGELEDPEDVAILVFSSNVARRASGQVAVVGSEPSPGENVRIIGFGCNNLTTKRGAGVKRAGTNNIAGVGTYIELTTPVTVSTQSGEVDEELDGRGILGPKDQAGSCFGDSGGPMLRTEGSGNSLVGITHAGGTNGSYILSQYININRGSVAAFIRSVDSNYNLGVFDTCNAEDSIQGPPCGTQSAMTGIVGFLKSLFIKVMSWFSIYL